MNATRTPAIPQGGHVARGAWAALPRAVQAAMGPNDKFDLLIRNANVLDPSQRLTGTPRHRLPLRPGRGDRADHRRRARRARAGRRRQAGDAGADRPALPHVSLRLGHRHPGRRAGGASVHHHGGLGRRRRRQQLRRLPALHRPGVAHAPVRVRAHRGRRARRISGARALQHRLRTARSRGPRRRRERRHGARREGADERERRSPATAWSRCAARSRRASCRACPPR